MQKATENCHRYIVKLKSIFGYYYFYINYCTHQKNHSGFFSQFLQKLCVIFMDILSVFSSNCKIKEYMNHIFMNFNSLSLFNYLLRNQIKYKMSHFEFFCHLSKIRVKVTKLRPSYLRHKISFETSASTNT